MRPVLMFDAGSRPQPDVICIKFEDAVCAVIYRHIHCGKKKSEIFGIIGKSSIPWDTLMGDDP